MTGSGLEKLFFVVSLIDRVSKPSKGVNKSLLAVQRTAKDGFMNIGKGALSIGATGAALSAFTGPARDFNKALGEVASLDVLPEELDKLGAAGNKFAMQFGGNAADIVRAGYDIQSAIPGLAKGALAAFTYQGALLAKATKADVATITSYTGTMYGIFEKDAKRIGQAKWVEQLTGKTAEAVKMFKTTGPAMAAAFSNLGSNGQIAGVSMDEQMAVLGTLQVSMGGANAGTAYAGFLNKTADASKALGLKFTDANKRLLPMTEVLEKIRGKFADSKGEINEFNKSKIMKAFGETGGRAVLNLLDKTGALKESIAKLNAVGDDSGAVKMAMSMTDPLERFNAVLLIVRTTLGRSLLPVVNAVLNIMSGGLAVVVWLLDHIPPLRWIFAAVAFAVAGVSMAFGALWVVLGMMKLFDALATKLRIIRLWMIFSAKAVHRNTLAYKAGAVARYLYDKAALVGIGIQRTATGLQWLWNASLKSGVVWQKARAIYTAVLNVLTGKQTVATAAATVATNGLSWATMKLALKNKLHALWTGLCTAATVGLKVAMFALKLVMLAGAVPAAIATAAALGIYKFGCIAAGAVSWLLTTGLWAVVTAVWSFTVALLACPITWIVVGVLALIGVLVAVVVYWDDVKAAALACWDWIVAAAKWCWELLTWAFDAYFDLWCDGWNVIAGAAGAVWNWIVSSATWCWNVLKAGVSAYFDFWCGIWRAVWDTAGTVWNWIVSAATWCWNALKAGVSAYFDFWCGSWRAVWEAAGAVWDYLTDAASWCWDALKGGAAAYLEFWTGLWEMVWNGAGWVFDKITAAWDNTVGLLGKAWKWLTGDEANVEVNQVKQTRINAAPEATAARRPSKDVPAGGIRNQSTNNTVNYGGVTINTSAPVGPGMLEDMYALNGGV